MSEWKSFCLGDVCKFIDYRGKTPPKVKSGVSLVTAKIIKNGLIQEPKEFIAEEFYSEWMRRGIPKKGDVIFTTEAPLGEVAQIKTDRKLAFAQRVIILESDDDILCSSYLFYALQDIKLKSRIEARQSGTTVSGIKASELRKVEIDLPPLETQKKIAAVLSALDDKIELNNAINKNLEEQAQAIYKNMFVNKFKIGSIGDYCKVKSGYAFKSKWWQSKGIRVIKIGSINQDELNLMECSFVSEDKLELASNFVVSAGDLVIAMTGATIGKFTFVPRIDEVLLVNQRVGKFFLGDEPIQRLPFIYCTLKQDSVYSKLINKGQGSAQPNISPQDIMSIPCIMPSNVEIEKFNKVTLPFFETMSENHFGNKKFGELRDTLLPRLMSGEIDVSEVEI